MTPTLISAEAKDAGLNVATLDIPSQAVAGKTIDTGSEAQALAGYMRIHALEASGGQVYAEMGRFLDKNGKATNDEALAAKDSTGQPVPNQARNLSLRDGARDRAEHLVLRKSGSVYSRLQSVGRFFSPASDSSSLRLAGRFARTRPRLRPRASPGRSLNQPRRRRSTNHGRLGVGRAFR